MAFDEMGVDASQRTKGKNALRHRSFGESQYVRSPEKLLLMQKSAQRESATCVGLRRVSHFVEPPRCCVFPLNFSRNCTRV